MTETGAWLLGWAVDISFVMIMLAMVLAFLRLGLGPTLPDRVVALDLITMLAVAFAALFAQEGGTLLRAEIAALLDTQPQAMAEKKAIASYIPLGHLFPIRVS